MGFNSGFKGLMHINLHVYYRTEEHIVATLTHQWDRRMGGNYKSSRKLHENQHNTHDQT